MFESMTRIDLAQGKFPLVMRADIVVSGKWMKFTFWVDYFFRASSFYCWPPIIGEKAFGCVFTYQMLNGNSKNLEIS